MREWLLLGLAAIGLVLVAFSSGVETGSYALNHARLRLNVAAGHWRSRLLARLVADLPSLLGAVLVGRAAAHALISFAVTLTFERWVEHGAELFAALTVAPLVFVLGELAPKELFRRHADRFMTWASPGLAVAEAVFAPLTRILGMLPRALAAIGFREHREEERGLAAEELRLTIQASAEEGVLTDFQAALARNILSLRHRRVASAMVPLARVHGVDINATIVEAQEIAARAGRSRLLVFRGKPEDALGVVALYDLFLDKDPVSLANLTRAAPRISPEDRVEDALVRLRLARQNLAIVAAPGGKVVGIVTMKDLCEEITGELDDL